MRLWHLLRRSEAVTRYTEHVNDRETSQRVKARPDQVQNSAGGFVFAVDKWTRLDRFLILGAEGGTYYISEQKLVVDNAASLKACLAEDGARVVRRIVEISDAGRAPKNDPAIFALALAAGDKNPVTRALALAALPHVCRIATHLFHFTADVGNFRGWGPGLQKAVAAWYTSRPADKLALQAIKYQQRDGWAHRDVLRLAHPTPPTPEHNALFRYMRGDRRGATPAVGLSSPKHVRVDRDVGELPAMVQAFEQIHADGVLWNTARDLIAEYRLPHECVPNELKNRPEIWEALLPHMGQTAIIRNLGKMTSVGLLKPFAASTRAVAATLTDASKLFAGRIHPIAILLALKTYALGHGIKGSLSWSPVREIIDALDGAFYLAFQAIEPTNKRHMLCLDVSGSMAGSMVAGSALSAREATAAMAMVTARTEKQWLCFGFSNRFIPLTISPRQRLDDAIKAISGLPFERTDCSLPMVYALEEKIEVDAFTVYTDSETYAGRIHPHQALEQYRQRMGIPAKLVVVGTDATPFTIANPDDAGMLDVVGFDAAVPGVIADFVAAREVVN